jgi:aspartate aminotransferase-like enzyme
MKKKYLLAPCPTTAPEGVSLEMDLRMQHHRIPQLRKIFCEATESAKYLLKTKQDVLFLAATGTAGDML